MPRKGENIYKRKDGRWEGRYIKCHKNNKAIYGYIYGKSYVEVKSKLKTAITKNESDLRSKMNITLKQLSSLWLDHKRNIVKLSTLCRYKSIIDVHIVSVIGDVNICDFNTETAQDYINYLLAQGRKDNNGGLSQKTVADVLSVLKSLLLFAENNCYKHSCCLKYLSCRQANKEMRVLSNAEQQALTTYLRANPDFTNNAIILALYTGIRIGELCALRYESFDFTNESLSIKSTLQRIQTSDISSKKTSLLLMEPKSASSVRKIPIPKIVNDLYNNADFQNSDYILSGNSVPIEPRTLQYRFQRILKNLNIENSTFHTLRHTFATRCVELGFDIKSLSEILGHSSVKITLDRYVHSSFELKSENMKKLELLSMYSPSE